MYAKSAKCDTRKAFGRNNTGLAKLSKGSTKVSVIIKVRPFIDNENSDEACPFVFDGERRIILHSSMQNVSRSYQFDRVLRPNATQAETFETCDIRGVVENALKGFNCLLFAHGPTGSGKTYTLTGSSSGHVSFSERGLLQRAFVCISELLKKHIDEVQCAIKVSFYEVYNEKIRDLLNGTKEQVHTVRWSAEKGFHVSTLITTEVVSAKQLDKILYDGLRQRQTASNAVNYHSSRSHCIFEIFFESDWFVADEDRSEDTQTRYGKITFVDLAGSEKLRHDSIMINRSLRETKSINKSLLVLGKCINRLSEKKRGKPSQLSAASNRSFPISNLTCEHIPYRDSLLTKLLSSGLDGNGYTIMIATISPTTRSFAETLNTLRYASRAGNIESKPVSNLVTQDTHGITKGVTALKNEIRRLEAENTKLKKLVVDENNTTSQRKRQRRKKTDSEARLNTEAHASDKALPKEVLEKIQQLLDENKLLRQTQQQLLLTQPQVEAELLRIGKENERLTKLLQDAAKSLNKN